MNTQALFQIVQLLEDNHIEYSLLSHPPCHTSAESAAARTEAGYPEAVGAKALLCKMERASGVEFNVIVLPGTFRLDSSALKVSIPNLRKFRFATPEEMFNLCRVVPGCMPPFAKNIFPELGHLFIDESLASFEWVGFNVASLEKSIIVRSLDYLRVAAPTSILRFAAANS